MPVLRDPVVRNVRRPRRTSRGQARTFKPTGVFGGLAPPTQTFTRAQTKARRKTGRAQKRLPERPLPAIPVLRNPTPRQKEAARSLIRRSRRNQAGRGASPRRLAELDRELMEDPRSRDRLELARALTDLSPRMRAQLVAGFERNRVSAGSPHTRVGLGPAMVDLTAIDRATFGALTDRVTRGGYGIAGRAVADAINLPKTLTVGAFDWGRAGVEAIGGDTRRARALVGTLDEGVLGRLAVGDPKGALRAFDEHPLYGALELTGAGQVAGRGAGAAMRSGALGQGAKRAASTRRAPLQVIEGSGQTVPRSYSKNVLVKALQVGSERSARRQGRDPDVATETPVGRFATPLRGHAKRDRASLMDSAVDEFAAQAEALRRRGRVEVGGRVKRLEPARARGRRAVIDRALTRSADAAVRPAGARRRPERDLVFAAVEGRVRPGSWRKDLQRERQRLVAVREEGLSRSARLENDRQVKAIDRALADKDFDPQALFRSAGAVAAESRRLEAAAVALRIVDPEQARAARLRPAAVAVLGMRDAPDGKGLVDRAGQRLTTPQVERRLKAAGVDPDRIGFLGHRRDQRSARSFFVNWFDRRQSVDSKRRSGEATRKGAHASDFTAIGEDLVRRQGVLDAVAMFDAFIGQFSLRGPAGKLLTWEEAKRYADELAETTGVRWVPVRAFPARYDTKRWQEITDEQDAPSGPAVEPFAVRLVDEALRPPDRQARNVVLVPERQIKRFRAHQLTTTGVGGRIGQAVTGLFRTTVLPFSSKWVFGNAAEAALRSALEGIGPGTVLKGHVLMREMRKVDEALYRQFDARVRGGLMFGSQQQLKVRRAVEDFEEAPTVENLARVATVIGRLPVVRQTIGGVVALADVSLALNRGIERLFQTGVIGKQLRDEIRESTGSWHKAVGLQRKAIEDVARGLTNTPAQIRFARATDDILGKYQRFSPSTRRFIQTFAPFLPWFLNAGRFVAYTLPVRHPLKTAVAARTGEAMMAAWEAEHENTPPGSLRYAIPTADGGWLDLARYTPFGAFTEGPGILREQVLPQAQSPLLVLSGLSWKLRKLDTEDGEEVGDGKRIALALNAAAESLIPLVSLGRRLREGGETPYDDSTVFDPKTKPGTSYGGSAVRRAFDPLRPTYLSAPAGESPAAAPVSRRDLLLQRRAQALSESARTPDRRAELLERRARLLAGR